MKTVVDILKLARQLLAEPGVWIKQALATDKDGKRVAWSSNQACHFCAMGAIVRAANPEGRAHTSVDEAENEVRACELLESIIGGGGEYPRSLSYYWNSSNTNLAAFNDRPDTTLEEMLAVFDKAIEEATKRGM